MEGEFRHFEEIINTGDSLFVRRNYKAPAVKIEESVESRVCLRDTAVVVRRSRVLRVVYDVMEASSRIYIYIYIIYVLVRGITSEACGNDVYEVCYYSFFARVFTSEGGQALTSLG